MDLPFLAGFESSAPADSSGTASAVDATASQKSGDRTDGHYEQTSTYPSPDYSWVLVDWDLDTE